MELRITPYYCDKSATDVILPLEKIRIDSTGSWVIVGYPGVDGIEFRMKHNSTDLKVYAYYPIDDEHIEIALSPNDLINLWKADTLKL